MISKLLIVDDDNYKTVNIENLIASYNNSIEVSVERALNPGLLRIRNDTFDLIILDMSLPLFDKAESSNFNPFGGIKFLKEMKRKRIEIPTIIVTQYEIFGEGESRKTSEMIDIQCKEGFNNYYGLVIYSSINNKWTERLLKMIGDGKQ